MKLISAVIDPARLPRLREAFRRCPDFPGMTIDKVEGFSVSAEPPRTIRAELRDSASRTRLLILCPDAMVESLVDVILEQCRTGQKGDGHVWVSSVENHWRIRDAHSARPAADREGV